MKITKNQIQFLSDYVSIVESTTALGNKLKIISKENNKAMFVQKSQEATLIREIDCETSGAFELLVDTKTFWNFMNSVSEKDEIEITQNGFNIGEDKHYTFEVHNTAFFDVNEILKTIEESKTKDTTLAFSFKDFSNLRIAAKYMGKDKLQTVGFMRDKILGTDRFQIVYSDASFNLDKNYFIGKPAINLLLSHKGKVQEIDIYLAQSFYFFEIEGTLCVFDWSTYAVPDLFDSKPFSRFNQTDYVKLSKKDLYSSLSRMSYFVTDNPSMRIFITVNKDHMLIENRDFNKSFEKVQYLEQNTVLDNVTVIVNCKNLLTFLDNMEPNTDEVFFFVNRDENNRSTIRLEDSVKTFKFVHVLLKSEKI